MIEIMLAVTLFAIGLAAVAGLQYRTAAANTLANDYTNGLALAESYLTEVQTQATAWTGTNTPAALSVSRGEWFTPTGWSSSRVDVSRLAEGNSDARRAVFCVHYRVDDIIAGTLVRVTARAAWARADSRDLQSCAVTTVNSALDLNRASSGAGDPGGPTMRATMVSTLMRENQ
jgi:Tfp pilus assembly protein PilV